MREVVPVLRKIHRILLRFVLSLFIVLLVFLTAINLPFTFLNRQASVRDYSDWMGETLSADQNVIDVAMLGAHDAFTAQINLFSPVDPFSAAEIQTGVVGALIKGFSVKQSKTQVSGVADLLRAGVRYFDIRLTYKEDQEAWYTSHSYFSGKLNPILDELEAFLADHPGEFLILDIQHVYGLDATDPADLATGFTEIQSLFAASGLLDRAFPADAIPLSEVTYTDITQNKTRGGVLIFTKLPHSDPAFWDYALCIRSAWANTDDPAALYTFLSAEAEEIASGNALTGNQVPGITDRTDAREGLRVMQGVLTMQMNGEGIVTALLDWSLLNKAAAFNPNLIAQDAFAEWLDQMPIVMVDYADSHHGNFLDNVMEIIMEKNQNP